MCSCAVPLSEPVLNALAADGGGRAFDVRVADGNRVTAAVRGPLGITVPVDVTILGVDPRLNVTLQFNGLSGVAVAILGSCIPHATRDSGGRLHVALADFPQLAPYSAFLRYLQSVAVSTRPGVLTVNLVLVIKD